MVKEKKKCNRKCLMCQNRDIKTNFCKEKNEHCTTNMDFSKCENFRFADRLSMF